MSTREIRLLRGRVRIRPDRPARMIGRIHIPDQAQDNGLDRTKVRTGIVVAKGAPATTKSGHEIPHGFEVGDHVAYQFGQLEIEGDAMCAQSEVIGVVERGDPIPAVDREAN